MYFALFLPFLFIGCAHHSKWDSPKVYFDKAVQYKSKKHYIKALEQLKELRKHFFYSDYNQRAILLTADIYFAQFKYSKAALSYEKHLKLYPNTKTAYVLYQIGLSYKEQLPRLSERDLSLAAFSLKAFDQLLNLKQISPYHEKAKIEKQKILDKQADKELKIALFYKWQGWNQASLNRIQHFIENYGESPLMPKALLEGFLLAKLLDRESEMFKKRLIKDYPFSQEAKMIHGKTGTTKNPVF